MATLKEIQLEFEKLMLQKELNELKQAQSQEQQKEISKDDAFIKGFKKPY